MSIPILSAIQHSDLLLEIVTYLFPEDVLRLTLCSKYLHTAHVSDMIWIHLLRIYIRPQSPSVALHEAEVLPIAGLIMYALKIPSSIQLCFFLFRLGMPLLGYFRGLHQPPWGHLTRILPVVTSDNNLQIVIQNLASARFDAYPLDRTMPVSNELVVEYDHKKKNVGVDKKISAPFIGPITIGKAIISFSPDKICFGPPARPEVHVSRLPLVRHPPENHENRALHNCTGLFTAIYGPHGVELFHISYVSCPEESALYKERIASGTNDNDVPSMPYPRIEGLKIIGDPNVCAGRFSFLIDLSQTGRPIQSLSRSNEHMTVYQGQGQINVYPHAPDYKWMDCQLIVYSQPKEENINFTVSFLNLNSFRRAVLPSTVNDDFISEYSYDSPSRAPVSAGALMMTQPLTTTVASATNVSLQDKCEWKRLASGLSLEVREKCMSFLKSNWASVTEERFIYKV